jgi:hypothetical protein
VTHRCGTVGSHLVARKASETGCWGSAGPTLWALGASPTSALSCERAWLATLRSASSRPTDARNTPAWDNISAVFVGQQLLRPAPVGRSTW